MESNPRELRDWKHGMGTLCIVNLGAGTECCDVGLFCPIRVHILDAYHKVLLLR